MRDVNISVVTVDFLKVISYDNCPLRNTQRGDKIFLNYGVQDKKKKSSLAIPKVVFSFPFQHNFGYGCNLAYFTDDVTADEIRVSDLPSPRGHFGLMEHTLSLQVPEIIPYGPFGLSIFLQRLYAAITLKKPFQYQNWQCGSSRLLKK